MSRYGSNLFNTLIVLQVDYSEENSADNDKSMNNYLHVACQTLSLFAKECHKITVNFFLMENSQKGANTYNLNILYILIKIIEGPRYLNGSIINSNI